MKYRMTDEEHVELMNACKPVPVMAYSTPTGPMPMFDDPRTSAMRVWEKIATRVGCRVDSIGPSDGSDDHEFQAVPK